MKRKHYVEHEHASQHMCNASSTSTEHADGTCRRTTPTNHAKQACRSTIPTERMPTKHVVGSCRRNTPTEHPDGMPRIRLDIYVMSPLNSNGFCVLVCRQVVYACVILLPTLSMALNEEARLVDVPEGPSLRRQGTRHHRLAGQTFGIHGVSSGPTLS